MLKWSGPIHGYGSQIQEEEDGAQRVFRISVPPASLSSFLCSPHCLGGGGGGITCLWCLSATLTASASFSSGCSFFLVPADPGPAAPPAEPPWRAGPSG